MDIGLINAIRKLAIRALFFDDYLMEKLVLKGGNALDLIHKISKRGSLDLDFSIEGDFDKEDLPIIKERMNKNLIDEFAQAGFYVFDITFEERPKVIRNDIREFWGGYLVTFKVLEISKARNLGSDIESYRRNAIETGYRHERKLRIEISKFEYCKNKEPYILDGLTIYVYPLELILREKIRALCQQVPEYESIIGSKTSTARAKDFFDIYTIFENEELGFNLIGPDTLDLIRVVFDAKRVPLRLIGQLSKTKEDHRADFFSLKDTVGPGIELKEYDYYFDYVIEKLRALEPLWKEYSPPL